MTRKRRSPSVLTHSYINPYEPRPLHAVRCLDSFCWFRYNPQSLASFISACRHARAHYNLNKHLESF